MVEANDDMTPVVDYSPHTQKPKPPNIFYNPKIWPNVKPFVEGGLAGAMTSIPFMTGTLIRVMSLKSLAKKHNSLIHELRYRNLKPEEQEVLAMFHKFLISNQAIDVDKFLSQQRKFVNAAVKRIPSLLVVTTIKNAMLFGPFGFLTRQVEAANKGMPLSIYQEAGCGIISGAVGACVTAPLYMSYYHAFHTPNSTPTSVIQDLYGKSTKEGILALWKGGRCIGSGLFVMNVGMLASYNRSHEYLRESVGLTANNSVLGAGLVSGFFAAACFYPSVYVHQAMASMKPGIDGKYPYSGYLDCVRKILKFSGPLSFYRGSTGHFLHLNINVMVLWYCLQKVKKIEESYGW